MDTLVLIVSVSALLLLVMVLTRPKEKPGPPRPQQVKRLDPAVQETFDRSARRAVAPTGGAETYWERRALSQLRGDRAALERLVAYQARRMPRASRAELLRRVYDEHVRDQR